MSAAHVAARTWAIGIVRGLRVALVALVALVAAGVAGCGGGGFQRAQGARYSTIDDPDPAQYAGRRPVVVLEGQATYYSDSLAGNHTANGEIYDPARRTAASRDLPFGSVVRVIRRDTGAEVTVRINDRGPFGKRARILDLSRAAAADLRMIDRGVAPIRAEVIMLGETRRKRR